MDNTRQQSVIPIRAHLASVQVMGDLGGTNSTKRADHFVVVYLDDKEVAKSEKKLRQPAPRWEWPEDYQLLFHPSSAIKIVIYRKSKNLIEKHVVGQFEGKVIGLLDNDAIVDLQDKTGAEITSKIKIKLSLVPETENTFKSFMKTVDDNISRMESAVTTTTGTTALGALGRALQLTKNIMDLVAGTHPILQASWTVMSAVYTAVQQAALLDDTVRALAEVLRETLGIAKEYPDLLVIEGTTDVIEEIGRTSLKVASLIHEYTRPAFMARTVKFQLSDDMKTRITECQKSCDDLKQKFNTRVIIDTNRQVKIIKDDQLSEKIYRWLSAPDSSRNYIEAREKHQEDTCSWFLDGECFREFQEKADFLWIKGKAGCGKTILCSAIIDKIKKLRIENPSTTYAYFFFDGRDSQEDLQHHDKLIRSLILQLSLQCDGIPAALVDLYGHGYHHPSTDSLEDVLYDIIDGMSLTYIIIDSLDECTERKKSLQWIKRLISPSRRIATLHLAVISRPEQDIEDVLQPLDAHCVDLAEDSKNDDIAMYLNRELSVLETPWDKETQEIIKSTLKKKADGMFRWVALQLMELQTCSSPAGVMTQLNALPTGLYETYDRILLKGDKKDHIDITTLLRWLCFSVRPMDLAEIAETVAVRFDDARGPYFSTSHRYYDKKHVLKKCSGLIVESEGKIKLAHFSIKEYLLSDQLLESEGAISSFHLSSIQTSHSLISQTCLAYLLQFNAPGSVDSNTTVSFPLAHYAAEHWVSHAHSGGIDTLDSEPSHALVLAKKLLTPNSTTLTNWLRLWDCEDPLAFAFPEIQLYLDQITLAPTLYYTSLMGLYQLSRDLSKEVDINAQGGRYGTALQAASYGGHEAIVKLLLEQGADVNVQGGEYGNALQAALGSWMKSNEVIVELAELLLKNGADVNVQGGKYGNALQAASYQGNDAVVELLLKKGADVNAQGGQYGTALQAASWVGEEAIVALLLKNGADVNAQGGEYGNALQAASASWKKNAGIMEMLLKNGADVNVQGGKYGNALQAASHKGTDAVELLIKNGADVNAQGGKYDNALQAASYEGNDAVVELLLKNGADVNAQAGFYGNALQAASWMGKEAMVELLLKNGADVNGQGGFYGNALQAASHKGTDAVVELLIKNGADVNAQGGEYGNALVAASLMGEDAVVELLLKNGADVNGQGEFYGNALQAASHKGTDAVVELLIKNGADVNAQEGNHGNALQAASWAEEDAVVELLLKNSREDVNAQEGNYGNALQAASWAEEDAIVELLLKNSRADVNAQGRRYGSAFVAASYEGEYAVAELLSKNRADVNAQGGKYGNALVAASWKGKETTVVLLLKNGADVNAQGGKFGNALQAASYGGKDATVALLLKNGADVNAQGGKYGNALVAASWRGQETTVALLLKNGVDVNAQSGKYGNPLEAASIRGHDSILALLLANGADNTIST